MWAFGSIAGAAVISVNVTETSDMHPNQQLAPATSAGAAGYVVSGWNNIATNSGAAADLNDDSGSATTADVSWAANGVWGDGSANDDANLGVGNAQLQRGYFDENPTGFTIDVTEIPYDEYSLVLYYSSDQGAGGTHGGVDVNGTPTGPTGETLPWVDSPALTVGQNVQVVSGLTGASLQIVGPARDGSVRHSVSGFQIVELVPEPTVIGLLSVAGVMLGFGSRRR